MAKGLSGGMIPLGWKRVVMNGKRGLEASEFMPRRVSSVISGWESRNRASGGLQCIEVVRERNLNIRAGEGVEEEEGAMGRIHVGECLLGSSMTSAVRLTILRNVLSSNE